MFKFFKREKDKAENLSIENSKDKAHEFSDVDDAIQIAINEGYDEKKAVLFVLNELIKEYEYYISLHLKLAAERSYKKIEYCRTRKI